MGKTTGISWTNATYNPWRGCHKISEGCGHCYMYREQERYGKDPSVVVRAKAATFNAPLTWKEPMMVFTCSWSDFFIKEADPWRDEAYEIIRRTPWLTYQICTKRPELIPDRLPKDWGDGWPNVWLGVTVESQEYLDRARFLANIPAVLRFISFEPSLGRTSFEFVFTGDKFKWLISGGESGPRYRIVDPEWFEHARRACEVYNVAYFHKQNGGNKKIDGAWGGDKLNGVVYHNFPEVQHG
jgi:protein gp37